ncbi:MAG: thiamine pyrophosphate-binding protein [Bacteroidota bacterium]
MRKVIGNKPQVVKISDYIISFLEEINVRHIFLISGGGNIHLIDSVGKSKKIHYVCNHHEQACAIAAEAYSRISEDIGVCLVTTGPGGTNAITGVVGAWLDSIPMLVISGQVKRETIGAGRGYRQLGDQEINIIDMVKPVTKYAVTIMNPNDVRYHLEKALFLAKSGRQGPVWLDIPIDVQGVHVDRNKLRRFKESEVTIPFEKNPKKLTEIVLQILTKLKSSKRPVIYAGNGIRLSGAVKEFLNLISLMKIPVLSSYAGYDIIPSSHPQYFGRAHTLGQRAANFIIQNCDLLISIGARLDIRTIGFSYKSFARDAYKVTVDIDRSELKKPFIKTDLPVNYDAKQFISEMTHQLSKIKLNLDISYWLDYCKNMNSKYPIVLKEYWSEKKFVNPYCMIDTLGKLIENDEIIVVSNGTGPLNCSYQALYIKNGQRVILNNGCSQMGYGLPAAIGAAFADRGRRVLCFEGDGSLQLNIHELQVIKHYKLPIKLFVYSNDGYLSIRNTQNNLFSGMHTASDPKSGVSCPDYVKIAEAYGIKAVRVHNHAEMRNKIKYVLNYPGPIVCDINMIKEMIVNPKLVAKKDAEGNFTSPPLEDMSPFLPKDELVKNMLIPLWKK